MRAPAIPDAASEALLALPRLIKLTYRLMRDPRISKRKRIFALGALGYLVSPVDVVPDFVPVIGRVDDVLVVALALRHLLDGADPEILAEHWDGSDDALDTVNAVIGWAAELVPKSVRFGVRKLVADGPATEAEVS